jgi:hypothetical protein
MNLNTIALTMTIPKFLKSGRDNPDIIQGKISTAYIIAELFTVFWNQNRHRKKKSLVKNDETCESISD